MFRTELYRGRRVVAESFSGIVREDPGSDPSDVDNQWTHWYGAAGVRVETEAGEALTPQISELEGWMHGYRCTWSDTLEVSGFGLLGDFIFFLRAGTDNWGMGPDSNLYLVCPGEGNGEPVTLDAFLSSDRVIPIFTRDEAGRAAYPFGKGKGHREKHLPAVARFTDDALWLLNDLAESGKPPDYRMEHVADFTDGTVTLAVSADTLGAVGGIARLFVPDHGWRWLFPHEDGPAAALEHLKASAHSDDGSVFSSMTFSDDMTDTAKRLITYHDLNQVKEDISTLFERLFADDPEGKPSKWDCERAVGNLEREIGALYEKG